MKKQLGKLGEKKAAEFLEKIGYSILHRNFRTLYGELDIVCQYRNSLIFVEVKTRTSIKFGYPEEAITYPKIKHLKKAAAIYVNTENCRFREIRFDVIAILICDGEWSINHIKNAF